MKLTLTVTLLLSSLSFAVGQNITTQPSDDAKPPVRTQPLGELLMSDTPQSAAAEDNSPAIEISPATGGSPAIEISPATGGSPATARPPATAKSPAIEPIAPTVKRLAKPSVTPPVLIAAAMENNDAEHRLTGRGMTLVEALSYANSPQRQLDVIHAYWHLVGSVASYNLECRLVNRLQNLSGPAADRTAIQTELASAAASREEARCVALSAQHSLAEAAMLGVGDSLPLPTDIPHVGAYRTRFAEMFSARPAPPRLMLIDRALPIHCRAIDARARAIAAAEKSLQVATADYEAGRGDLEAVISRISQLSRQHLALVNSVCNYNHEIVEYAVTSLAQPISGQALVARLIETKHGDGRHFDPRTLPASATRPLSSQLPGRLPAQSPTLAPPRTGGSNSEAPWSHVPDEADNPMQAPQRLEPAVREPTRLDPQNNSPVHQGLLLNDGAAEKTENVEPSQTDKSETNLMQTRPVVPVQAPQQPLELPQPQSHWMPPARTTYKPIAATGLYPALVSASPANRAKHLVKTLHWDRNLPSNAGRAIDLADYLGLGQGINRQALVEAFWLNRQRVAEFQVLDQQMQLLDEIQVAGSERLQAARAAAEADTIDAHIRLLESQFLLTDLVGKTLEPAWLTARGVPRFAVYNLDAVGSEVDTWELRCRRATIPVIHETICRHAVAVVEVDSARADAISQADRSLDDALNRTFQQTEETLALLASVTAYNNAVARYVLRVLPPQVSSQVLAQKLLAGS